MLEHSAATTIWSGKNILMEIYDDETICYSRDPLLQTMNTLKLDFVLMMQEVRINYSF